MNTHKYSANPISPKFNYSPVEPVMNAFYKLLIDKQAYYDKRFAEGKEDRYLKFLEREISILRKAYEVFYSLHDDYLDMFKQANPFYLDNKRLKSENEQLRKNIFVLNDVVRSANESEEIALCKVLELSRAASRMEQLAKDRLIQLENALKMLNLQKRIA